MSERPAPTFHDSVRRVVLQLFPWLAYFYLDPASKDLVMRAASGKLHLAGDANDPPVARKADGVGELRVVKDPSPPNAILALFWRPNAGDAWTQIVGGILVVAPLPTDPGTPIYITTGSTRVTCK